MNINTETPISESLRFLSLHIDGRIHKVYISLIQLFSQQLHRLTEPLEMNHFPFTKELDHIIHVGIIGQPQNIIIGHPSLLLCCNGKSATFANKINPIGFILYHIPLKTEYFTIFARKLYHILPLAKYITKNSNVLLSERP